MRVGIRRFLGGLFFSVYGLGSLLIGGLVFPVLACLGARRTMRMTVRASWRLFLWAIARAGICDVSISAADRARLASIRGCVVVANHPTLLDIVILAALLPDATGIAKAAAGRNFFYSLIVKGMFLVNDDPARVLEEAARLLADGVNLIVFPEGTRTPVTAAAHPLRRGAAQIAQRARVPIVPVSLVCEPPILAKGQPWYDLSDRTAIWKITVHEEISPARFPASLPPHAAAARLTRVVHQRLFTC